MSENNGALLGLVIFVALNVFGFWLQTDSTIKDTSSYPTMQEADVYNFDRQLAGH